MRWFRNVRNLETLVLSALTGLALTVDAYAGGSHAARFAVVLTVLNALHALCYPRFALFREISIYLTFIAYMLITLLWADDVMLALRTVLLATNFALILLLLGALVSYHDLTAVLPGLVFGFLIGAVTYAITARFPLVVPEDFSYNTMAGMYLFGLFVTVVCGWYLRWRVVSMGLSLVLVLHIVATTSIKTNLGVALGLAVVGLIYVRNLAKVFVRNFVLIIILGGAAAYHIASSGGFSDRLQSGLTRVSRGAQILETRKDESGSVSFDRRQYWMAEGLKGWERNPLLGNGVEAFRADYGITSHSTVVDLLYNSGLIGCTLFYGMFATIGWRLYRMRSSSVHGFQAIVTAGMACYLFMSLSATLYYDTYVAVFVAISVGVLRRISRQVPESCQVTRQLPHP